MVTYPACNFTLTKVPKKLPIYISVKSEPPRTYLSKKARSDVRCVSQLSEEELDTEEHAPGGAEAEVVIPDIGLLAEVLDAILC